MNYKLLQRKFLLLDTNILIYSTKYPPFFEGFFDNLELHETSLIVNELVKFEFLRGAANNQEFAGLKDYLKLLLKQTDHQTVIPQFAITTDTLKNAIEISSIYSWKLKNNKISLADCMVAAEMRKYNEHTDQLFLATTDHDDFPNLFFDRIGIETIDAKDKIFNVGFYAFNPTAYKKLSAEFCNS